MKIKIKSFLLLLYLMWILIFESSAQNPDTIDCKNDVLVTSIFNDPIDLTLRGIIKIYENVTINEILSTTNNEFAYNYIDARLEADSVLNETKSLILFTTKHFENYAKEQTATRISLKINLGCGMGKERVVIFFLPLKEGNYYSPVFSKSVYELIIPTPIFVGFDLTAFLEITAKDDDLTHNRILFTSNDSLHHYIRVGTKNITSADKKTHFANLTLEKILLELPPQTIEFGIVATDSGDPPKSSTAIVMLRSDPKRSLPVKPKFSKQFYRGLIKSDFTMDPIQLQLVNGTYTPEIKFFLDDVSSTQGFHLEDNKNGSIDITWSSKNLNRSFILQQKIWELEVKAEHKILAEMESANVFVEMQDIKINFNFMSSFYQGHIDEMGKLYIKPIIFNPTTYQPDMDFKLQDAHNIFYFTRQNFTIQLQLNNNFTWHKLDDIEYFKLSVQALWQNLSSVTHIVVKLPLTKNKAFKQMFHFEKPVYVGQLKETYSLQLETINLKTDVGNFNEIEYHLSGTLDGSNKFFKIQIENHTRIEIESIFNHTSQPEIKFENSWLLLLLEASYNDSKAFASVLIKVPQANDTTMKSKIFVKHFVLGKILSSNDSQQQQLSIESISVATDWRDKFEKLKFRLTGEHSLYFNIKRNRTSFEINITLKSPLTSKSLATKSFLNMNLQAFSEQSNGLNDTLMVFIELPIKECPTLSKISLADAPHFSNSNYVFTVYTNQTGALGAVKAFSRNATFHYILGVENDQLAQRLSVNPFTGEITLYGIMAAGQYLFNITAEDVQTQERAVAKALLNVQKHEECKLYEGVAVKNMLMILQVDEEKPNYGVLDLKFNENCTFHIEDMWPTDKEYVHVNYIFNMLDMIAVDREDEIFENMSDPHVKVKLRLKCEKEDSLRNLTIDIPPPIDTRSVQINFTEDIPYSPDTMWLYIKINDINDNAPEFKISEGPLYLGYPAGNASFDVYPEYLIEIKAFDRDVGLNAEILYGLNYNKYFDIEPSTGRIYPKGLVLDNNKQTELIILAIDQKGEGLISRTVVIVKGLSTDFFSLITLRETAARTKHQMEIDLSAETGYDINILKMSYVPQLPQMRSKQNHSFSCKAWIYAYHKHQLMTYKEIQKQISLKNSHTNSVVVTMESYNEAALRVFTRKDANNFGYFMATILLSLTSCFLVSFIIWRFYNDYKAKQMVVCDTKTSSSTLIDDRMGNETQPKCAAYSHDSAKVIDCGECDNHVKFSDLVENIMVVDGSLSK